jgi:hypothetical protein
LGRGLAPHCPVPGQRERQPRAQQSVGSDPRQVPAQQVGRQVPQVRADLGRELPAVRARDGP